LYDESYRFFLEFLGKRTPDHGLALQTTRYLLFEPSKGIEPLQLAFATRPCTCTCNLHLQPATCNLQPATCNLQAIQYFSLRGNRLRRPLLNSPLDQANRQR
ncbi:hypothetical protein PI859_00005, partial [Burkholderia pseudomallei]|uniref:hypothetical protein n=1 Tax=Burkholderia pseudomallei TaxID=28450 RepID=UPI0022FEFE9A